LLLPAEIAAVAARYHSAVAPRGLWLGLWLVVLASVLALALVKRDREHRAVERRLVADLLPRTQQDEFHDWFDAYLWGSSFDVASPQGAAIYLLKRGYASSKLKQALLLAEAHRPREWVYTYPEVRNHDLRTGLIADCLQAFPNDLQVAWAVGTLALTAGDAELAAAQLGRHFTGAPDPAALNQLCFDYRISPHNLVGRYCAALTLTGRDAEAGALLQRLASFQHSDEYAAARYAGMYCNWLAENGAYAQLLAALDEPSGLPQDVALRLRAEALYWTGRLDEFTALVTANWDQLYPPGYLENVIPIFDDDVIQATRQMQRAEYLARNPTAAASALEPHLDASGRSINSELAAITNDARWLAPLRTAPRLAASGQTPEFSTRTPAQLKQLAGIAASRAAVLGADWTAAARELELVEPLEPWLLDDSRAYAAVQLLVDIALNRPLGAQAYPVEPATAGSDVDYARDGAPGGPLAELREGDTLVALIRSPQFGSAVAHSGRPLPDVLADVETATRPHRELYHDSSNGGLHD
jgi:hypothetical protein